VAVPILRQGDLLIASIQATLADQDFVRLREDLARAIGGGRSRGVIIDVSALDVLDSFATKTLRSIAETARLRGARTVVVGVQPDVAIAMVELGVTLDGVATALDFEDGVELLRRESARRARRRREGAGP
jgi:rsbT antagonist protein RsbS